MAIRKKKTVDDFIDDFLESKRPKSHLDGGNKRFTISINTHQRKKRKLLGSERFLSLVIGQRFSFFPPFFEIGSIGSFADNVSKHFVVLF